MATQLKLFASLGHVWSSQDGQVLAQPIFHNGLSAAVASGPVCPQLQMPSHLPIWEKKAVPRALERFRQLADNLKIGASHIHDVSNRLLRSRYARKIRRSGRKLTAVDLQNTMYTMYQHLYKRKRLLKC